MLTREPKYDSVAEWSKAVRSGRILNWHGFESHRCHFFLINQEFYHLNPVVMPSATIIDALILFYYSYTECFTECAGRSDFLLKIYEKYLKSKMLWVQTCNNKRSIERNSYKY